MEEKIKQVYEKLLLENKESRWVNPELDIPNGSDFTHSFWVDLESYREFRMIDGVKIISILNSDTTSFYIKIN